MVPDWPGTGRSGYIALDQLNGATVVEGLGALIRTLGAPLVLLTHSMSGCYGWRLLELHGDIIDTLVGVAPGPPGNIQKEAPVYAETEREIETETSGQRVRIDKTAPVVPTRDFVERKLVGDSISRASGLRVMRPACAQSRPTFCSSGRTCTAGRCG